MFLSMGALLLLLAGATIVTVAVITYKKIKAYLSNLRIKSAVTRFVALHNAGNEQHVYAGIFDDERNSIPEATAFKGKSIDDETRHYLPEEEVILLDV